MKLLELGSLAVVACLVGLLLLAFGRLPETMPVSLGLTAAGAVCFLLALGALRGLARGFQQMLDDLQTRQAKT